MHFKLRLIPAATAAVLLVACGGGSNSPLTAASYTPSSGIAVDGYLQFSKVVCDTNDDLVAGATEPSVYTLGSGADSGKFTFPQGCVNHALLVAEGTNADTGLMFTGMMMAPASATVVSPLTTLMAAGMSQAQVITALGLPAGTNLLHTDPLAQTDLTIYKKALVVQQILQKSAELFAGMANLTGSVVNESVYAGVAVAFATALKSSPSPLIPASATPVVDVAVLNSLLTVAAQAGQQIFASGRFGAAAQTALSAIDLGAMAAVVAPALQVQAQTLLVAPDANLTALTSAAQSSTYITDYIKSIETQLAGSSTSPVDPTVITDLGATLASDVASGHNSISVGVTDTVLVTFDESTPAFTAMGAYGGALPTTPTAPSGGSGNALKIVKPAGQQVWGGVYFTVAAIPFAADRKKISARVYSTRADAIVKFKVEIPGGSNVEIASSPTGPANTWSTVTWDFSAVDITKSYTTIAITPDATLVTNGEGYYIDDITLLAPAVTPTVSTGGNFLSVANDAISLSDRGITTPISLTAFRASPGISVKWPMSSPATLNVTLAKVGNFTMAPSQTLKAAVQITETTTSGMGKVMAYIDNVGVSMSGNNITIAVPTSGAAAKVYGVSTDGAKKAVIDFSNSVANVSNTLSLSTANSILLGDAVNYAINNVSNDFTGITGLRGTYKVTIVVSDLPLKKADGTAFATQTISVPTALDANGAPTSPVSVTGPALEGYITLTN